MQSQIFILTLTVRLMDGDFSETIAKLELREYAKEHPEIKLDAKL